MDTVGEILLNIENPGAVMETRQQKLKKSLFQ
jgi:hypothetical protein